MIDYNDIAYTHPPTQWAVCDSYITTINNRIISNYIKKNISVSKSVMEELKKLSKKI